MSASLIILIPFVLLGLVTALCFVGCGLPVTGLPDDLGPYQNTITKHPNLIALWPLNDTRDPNAPPQTALAVGPPLTAFNGTYVGGFMLTQAGIVPGDVLPGSAIPTPCASFTGGRVQVPFHSELNPDATFTVEAWVKPNWGAGPPMAQNAVVVSANADPKINAGYGLLATPDNFWEANLGLGLSDPSAFLVTKFDKQIVTNVASYLALTFDGSMLTLFVGPVGGVVTSTSMPLPVNSKYQPELQATATQLFIAMGSPDAGANPFNGSIQDVAFYSPALNSADVQLHFALGSKPPG
jgi:hypothetical protein